MAEAREQGKKSSKDIYSIPIRGDTKVGGFKGPRGRLKGAGEDAQRLTRYSVLAIQFHTPMSGGSNCLHSISRSDASGLPPWTPAFTCTYLHTGNFKIMTF